ncbi:SapC family protein [Colwellia psychrerythraea]|uniref:SapC family protein n=1 Tax=Colwellia psychrerythraea TaxID=28229 RepID=A0A099L6J9_COLPS|nr:SapC family protein [Colwellia psychrerythraea]KGJ97508.1 SapC family protein [Colwellia psychrerythraea]
MAKFEPIRKEQHEHLKLASKRELTHIANQHIVSVTATEFAQASASFPVVLVKNPDSPRYRSVAMLGLESGENLFYKDKKWTGLSLPQSAGMAPFALGIDPEKENTLTACVDIESELVGVDKEVPFFDAEGKESELLVNVQKSLGRLYESEKMTENFIKELEENDLLHELELDINLANGEKKKLTGLFTVNEDKVKLLADDKVLDFHKRGLFVPIYAMLGSLGQLNRLVQLRNDTGNNQIAGVQIAPLNKQEAPAEVAES